MRLKLNPACDSVVTLLIQAGIDRLGQVELGQDLSDSRERPLMDDGEKVGKTGGGRRRKRRWHNDWNFRALSTKLLDGRGRAHSDLGEK